MSSTTPEERGGEETAAAAVIPKYCETHFEWAREELKKEEARHNERKVQIIHELEERLEKSKRVPLHKIAALVGHVLAKDGFVSERYVRMVTEEKYKEVKFKNKERKASEPEALSPPSQKQPQQQEVVVQVAQDGHAHSGHAEEPASKESKPAVAANEVEELRKKLAEANKVIRAKDQTIQVQKQTIDDISKVKPAATAAAATAIPTPTLKSLPQKIDTSEQTLRKKAEDLESKLAPFEQPAVIELDDLQMQQVAQHSGRLPVIVSVSPASHKVEVLVDERRLRSSRAR